MGGGILDGSLTLNTQSIKRRGMHPPSIWAPSILKERGIGTERSSKKRRSSKKGDEHVCVCLESAPWFLQLDLEDEENLLKPPWAFKNSKTWRPVWLCLNFALMSVWILSESLSEFLSDFLIWILAWNYLNFCQNFVWILMSEFCLNFWFWWKINFERQISAIEASLQWQCRRRPLDKKWGLRFFKNRGCQKKKTKKKQDWSQKGHPAFFGGPLDGPLILFLC